MSEEERNEEPRGDKDEPEVEVDVELDVTEEPTAGGDVEVEAVETETVSEDGEVVEEKVEVEQTVVEAAPEGKEGSELPPGADLEPISVEPEAELSAEDRARLEAEEQERAEREAAEAAEGEEDEAPARPAPAKIAKDARYIATGKRKRSVARVTILPGDGKVTVNERDIEEYFPRARHRTVVSSPLAVTGYESNVDIRITVHGGGISGQAGAARHGIARALTEVDSELRPELKRRGFLTRDARAKERRKAGLKKARKRPQFSKR